MSLHEKQGRVELPGLTTGRLTQDRYGRSQWLPDPVWEQRGQIPRLGLDFLRTPGSRTVNQDLPPWFENLLPERESALRMRLTSIYGLRDGQSFELLMKLGRQLPGAVEVRPDSEADEGIALEGEDRSSRLTGEAAGSPDSEEGTQLSSLSGVQLKFSMSMVNERLSFGAHSAKNEWIVKFPGNYEELAELETATMSWASQAGFEVPRHRTVPFEELEGIPEGWVERTPSVFAVERFDRRPDGTRVHHEDFCQALGLRPLNKYGEYPGEKHGKRAAGFSYDGVFRFVHDACGESGSREFARRLGFMIASGNTDAHLKNWGLLWGDRVRPALVPCYDLVCTIGWEKVGWGRRGGPRLALRMGTTHRFADIDDELLERLSVEAGCAWAAQEIRAGAESARNAFPVVRCPIPRRMVEALGEHWSRVPILRRLGPLRAPAWVAGG